MALCGAKTFDALLSDADMPNMNGHDLIRWVAANRPDITCLLMSGFSIECGECPFTGRCMLLRKPFGGNEAVALVTQMLNDRSGPD